MDKDDQMSEMDISKYQFELPIDGSENSEFLTMGIEFGPFQKGDRRRGANLPDGWVIEQSDAKDVYICDEQKRARVIVYLVSIQMRPLRRFRIGRDPYIKNPDENILFCIWDSNVMFPNKPKVVFKTEHAIPSRSQHKNAHDSRVKIYQNQFEKEAREWLSDRYPDWESYNGHWN